VPKFASIFAPAIGSVWKQLEATGIDPGPLFRDNGIDPETMFDAGARIPHDTFDKVCNEAFKLSGDPDFDLKGAEYFRPAHLGALGFAWLASSSLRTAFQRLSRYSKVINEKLNVDLEESDGYLVVTIDAQIPTRNETSRENGQHAAVIKFCRAIAGNDYNHARVYFRHPEPADTSYYYQLFRCPLEFEAEHTSLLIPLEVVDKRLTGSNDELAKLNEHIVVNYLAHSDKKDIVNRVKAAIIDQLGSGGVTEASIADTLYMTARNMHRKLQAKGTTFKALLTDVRQELAKQYIQDRSKTLTEISFMLGFSEVSSFSRAYKGWTGKPPSEARQASS
jgi:AraC-like DNA-binding protein